MPCCSLAALFISTADPYLIKYLDSMLCDTSSFVTVRLSFIFILACAMNYWLVIRHETISVVVSYVLILF